MLLIYEQIDNNNSLTKINGKEVVTIHAVKYHDDKLKKVLDESPNGVLILKMLHMEAKEFTENVYSRIGHLKLEKSYYYLEDVIDIIKVLKPNPMVLSKDNQYPELDEAFRQRMMITSEQLYDLGDNVMPVTQPDPDAWKTHGFRHIFESLLPHLIEMRTFNASQLCNLMQTKKYDYTWSKLSRDINSKKGGLSTFLAAHGFVRDDSEKYSVWTYQGG